MEMRDAIQTSISIVSGIAQSYSMYVVRSPLHAFVWYLVGVSSASPVVDVE